MPSLSNVRLPVVELPDGTTGRAPNLSQLGLGNIEVCITTGKLDGLGYSTLNAIAVDEYSCTMQANIFAVGDCTD